MSARDRNSSFDPFVVETLWTRLVAIADEAAAALVRTSFSTIVRESKDFACVLMDAQGNSLAQNTSTVPSFVGTLPRTARAFLERLPAHTWKPGDVVATNDPWLATGHLPDITVVMPVFFENRLVAFAGAIAHMPDIGGRIYSADSTELFEEGLNLPICHLYRGGEPVQVLLDLIRANVRVPDQTLGDLHAEIAACQVMGKRLVDMMKEYKLADVRALAKEIHERSAAGMRKAIQALPEGTSSAEVYTDRIDGERLRLAVTVTVAGGSIHCDYTGTSPQVRRGINAVYNCTLAHTAYYIKCALDPDVPNNEGALAPITVSVPEGTILNPRRPAAVNARQIILHHLHAVMFGALGQIAPKKVIAQCGAPSNRTLFAGKRNDGTPFSTLLFTSGGMGAGHNRDGLACTTFPTNSGAGSIEVMESTTPILFQKKALRPDSGGTGRYRGGLGQTIAIEILADEPVMASFLSDRIEHPAQGLEGGGPGLPATLRLLNRDAELPPKGRMLLQKGDVVEIGCPGGGGYGDASERDPRSVDADVRAGYLSDPSKSVLHPL
jgi:N-methylhydantoinase B